MRVVTLYHDPKQQLLHILASEVNTETGAHQVVTSEIHSLRPTFDLPAFIERLPSAFYGEKVVVRAYTITEIL